MGRRWHRQLFPEGAHASDLECRKVRAAINGRKLVFREPVRNQIEIGRADAAIFGEGRYAGRGAVAACSTLPSVLVDPCNSIIFAVESSGICAWAVRLTAF